MLFQEPAEGVEIPGRGDADDGVGADRRFEPLRGIQREDPSVVHDGQAIAERVGLLHIVRAQEDGGSFRVQPAKDLPQSNAALRV